MKVNEALRDAMKEAKETRQELARTVAMFDATRAHQRRLEDTMKNMFGEFLLVLPLDMLRNELRRRAGHLHLDPRHPDHKLLEESHPSDLVTRLSAELREYQQILEPLKRGVDASPLETLRRSAHEMRTSEGWRDLVEKVERERDEARAEIAEREREGSDLCVSLENAVRERDEASGALALLRRLATQGGAIVSTADLTPPQIALARADDRMWVEGGDGPGLGLGFVHVLAPVPAQDSAPERPMVAELLRRADAIDARLRKLESP